MRFTRRSARRPQEAEGKEQGMSGARRANLRSQDRGGMPPTCRSYSPFDPYFKLGPGEGGESGGLGVGFRPDAEVGTF